MPPEAYDELLAAGIEQLRKGYSALDRDLESYYAKRGHESATNENAVLLARLQASVRDLLTTAKNLRVRSQKADPAPRLMQALAAETRRLEVIQREITKRLTAY